MKRAAIPLLRIPREQVFDSDPHLHSTTSRQPRQVFTVYKYWETTTDNIFPACNIITCYTLILMWYVLWEKSSNTKRCLNPSTVFFFIQAHKIYCLHLYAVCTWQIDRWFMPVARYHTCTACISRQWIYYMEYSMQRCTKDHSPQRTECAAICFNVIKRGVLWFTVEFYSESNPFQSTEVIGHWRRRYNSD